MSKVARFVVHSALLALVVLSAGMLTPHVSAQSNNNDSRLGKVTVVVSGYYGGSFDVGPYPQKDGNVICRTATLRGDGSLSGSPKNGIYQASELKPFKGWWQGNGNRGCRATFKNVVVWKDNVTFQKVTIQGSLNNDIKESTVVEGWNNVDVDGEKFNWSLSKWMQPTVDFGTIINLEVSNSK